MSRTSIAGGRGDIIRRTLRVHEESNVETIQIAKPVCRCLHCGNEFTIHPIIGKDTVANYAERLGSEVFCFECGASSSQLEIVA